MGSSRSWGGGSFGAGASDTFVLAHDGPLIEVEAAIGEVPVGFGILIPMQECPVFIPFERRNGYIHPT